MIAARTRQPMQAVLGEAIDRLAGHAATLRRMQRDYLLAIGDEYCALAAAVTALDHERQGLIEQLAELMHTQQDAAPLTTAAGQGSARRSPLELPR